MRILVAALALAATPALSDVERTDFTAPSGPGITLGLREVVDPAAERRGAPVILVHGARVPGIPSFDLPVPGGSLAGDLAARGFAVYVADLRGYGASTRLPAMDEPATSGEPLVRSGEAALDVLAAVDAVRERTGAEQVSLVGWATGGHWAGLAATLAPDRIGKVVYYNTLYGGTSAHPTLGPGSRLTDPADPTRPNAEAIGNYRLNTGESLLPSWDKSIPGDPAAWRDPAVADAYVEAALASDPTAVTREPPSFRAPSGALADSVLLAGGASLWDARLTTADALVVRSENDFWSRPEDAERLMEHLNARTTGEAARVDLEDATHYVHLDRPERGRTAFVEALDAFLAD